jgi:hypothetical protein
VVNEDQGQPPLSLLGQSFARTGHAKRTLVGIIVILLGVGLIVLAVLAPSHVGASRGERAFTVGAGCVFAVAAAWRAFLRDHRARKQGATAADDA